MVEGTCLVCWGQLESIFHVFVDCYFARNCWCTSHVCYYRGSLNKFGDWLMFMLNRWSDAEKECVAMVLW